MSQFLELLKTFKENDHTFVVLLENQKTSVKIDSIDDDKVVLLNQNVDERFDLHYTKVIIVS
jgi:hypothetical protein